MLLTAIILFIVGAIAGALSGLIGIGGGTIMVPSIILLFDWLNFSPLHKAHIAIGTSIACTTLSMFSAALGQARQRNIKYNAFFRIAPGLMMGAILGPLLTPFIPDQVLTDIFAVILIFISFLMLLQTNKEEEYKDPLFILILMGLMISLLSSFSGLSGGALLVPFFAFLGMPMRNAVGTATLCSILITLVASTNYLLVATPANSPPYTLGYIYFPAVLIMGGTSIISAQVFVRVGARLRSVTLKNIFTVFIIALAIFLIVY